MRDDAPLVAVVDDDEAICRAVARLLDAEGYRVRTYRNAREYLDERDAGNPACVLLDIRMPELDGLELLRAVRDGGGDVPAVFMTATGDVSTVVEAMKGGALDLLAKPFTAEALGAAIGRAADAARELRTERRNLADLWRKIDRLTPREAEVCAFVACGLPNKRVAALIGTKEKTVKVHRGRVIQKLQVTSLADLVRVIDALLAEQSRRVIRLEGSNLVRPHSADIILDVMNRQRGTTPLPAGDSVDQRTMPHLA